MKKFLALIFVLFIACTPQATVTSEVIATAQTEIVIPTLIATPTLNPDQALQSLEDRIVAGEQIDLSRLTIEQQTRLMDGLADQYLAGNLREVSGFTFEQRNAFRLVLAEHINSRMAQEISYKNGEAFLDPRTLTMVTGSENPEDLVFQPAYNIIENADGSFSYTDQWGETHKITGLDKDDQPHVVTDATTNLIKFPQVDVRESGDYAGMPGSQSWLSESYSPSVPEHKQDGFYSNDVVFLRQVKGEAYFDLNRGRLEPQIILEFGKVIRDSSGKPILLYKFLSTQKNASTLFYQEGTNSKWGVLTNTRQEYMINLPANHMTWFGTYGTELSSVFHYTPQNAVDWSSLDLHTQAAIDFLQDGKLPKSKIPMIEGKIIIFEASSE